MNHHQAGELLYRAAASVTPAEKDPATTLAALGRRSVRRRRAWGGAGLAAAALAAVVAVPFVVAPDHSDDIVAATTVEFAGLTIDVPAGWRTVRVFAFSPCEAKAHTVYLGGEWNYGMPNSMSPGNTVTTCEPDPADWIGVVRKGVAPLVSPRRLVFKDGQAIQVEENDMRPAPSSWTYRAMSEEILAPTVFLPGDDEASRDRLLEHVTWPAGPPAPPGGGLALPSRITSATSDRADPSNGMVVATDAATLNQIRSRLAALRDPVPPAEKCVLKKPGSVGINLGETTVVLGDASCPQAISTGGGKVRAPAGLGQELLALIVASDDAATARDQQNKKGK